MWKYISLVCGFAVIVDANMYNYQYPYAQYQNPYPYQYTNQFASQYAPQYPQMYPSYPQQMPMQGYQQPMYPPPMSPEMYPSVSSEGLQGLNQQTPYYHQGQGYMNPYYMQPSNIPNYGQTIQTPHGNIPVEIIDVANIPPHLLPLLNPALQLQPNETTVVTQMDVNNKPVKSELVKGSTQQVKINRILEDNKKPIINVVTSKPYLKEDTTKSPYNYNATINKIKKY